MLLKINAEKKEVSSRTTWQKRPGERGLPKGFAFYEKDK
jgi:hypothetical protein